MNIRKAAIEEQITLQNLLQLYMYDFTEYTEVDTKPNGLYQVMPDFNLYWTEPQNRHPFLIMVSDKIAGFAFVKTKEMDKENHVVTFLYIEKVQIEWFRYSGS